jgi:hypothetical protein
MTDLMIDILKPHPPPRLFYTPNPTTKKQEREIFFTIAVIQISRSLHVRRDIFFAAVVHVGPEGNAAYATTRSHRRARLLDDGGLILYTHSGGNITAWGKAAWQCCR